MPAPMAVPTTRKNTADALKNGYLDIQAGTIKVNNPSYHNDCFFCIQSIPNALAVHTVSTDEKHNFIVSNKTVVRLTLLKTLNLLIKKTFYWLLIMLGNSIKQKYYSVKYFTYEVY